VSTSRSVLERRVRGRELEGDSAYREHAPPGVSNVVTVTACSRRAASRATNRHVDTLVDQRARTRETDPGAAAGHERGLSGKVQIRRSMER
jgi:hypothetical protein